MFELTLKFTTIAELSAAVAKLEGTVAGNAETPPRRGPGRPPNPPKAAGEAANGAAASPSSSTASPSPAAPAAPKVPKYEETGIGDMLKTASQDASKKAAAVALLNEFGAVKDGKVSGQHLKPEQFADFKAKLQVVLDAKEEEIA